MNLGKAAAIAGVVCLVLCGCEPARQPVAGSGLAAEWGMAVNSLRLSIQPAASLDPNAASCAFDVYFKNTGDEDIVLNLGSSLAKGRVHFPHAVRLSLFDSSGNARRLEFSFRADGAWKERMEVFAVPLPAGSVYTVRVNLSDYYCSDTGEYYIDLPDGEYRVFAGYTAADLPAAPDSNDITSPGFWTGKVQSNVARFRVARQAS